VRDAGSGARLQGATIGLKGTSRSVTTDANGRYTFTRVPYGPRTLVYARSGYRPVEVAISMPAGGALTRSRSLEPS
jgi:hypothetical protein